MNQIIDFYNNHKEQLLILWLAIQTVAKAINDALEAHKNEKPGIGKFLAVLFSAIAYLGIGKRPQ